MRNWGGTHTYAASELTTPTSLDELASIVTTADRIRVAGTRHTFSGITDAPLMVELGGLGERFEVDREAMTVTIDGAMTYGRLTALLAPEDLALHNLASLAHLCVAGAVATATHGSGDTNGCLSTALVGVELMTADGELLTRRRGDVDFDGLAVGLGAVGVVTSLTLRVEPAHQVRQEVHLGMPMADLVDALDDVFASGHSVSAFTRWGDVVEQLWVKQRIDAERPVADVVRATPQASEAVHPVPGNDPAACTTQLGIPGSWAERLPHFRFDAAPNAGHEIQSEYFVPREVGPAAVAALHGIGEDLRSVLMTGELRTIAADELWLSPFAGRASLAFHFTWHPDPPAVLAAAALVEEVLRPFEPRPHWGKVFTPGFSGTNPTPRRADAVELITSLDPDGTFANDWMRAEGLRSR